MSSTRLVFGAIWFMALYCLLFSESITSSISFKESTFPWPGRRVSLSLPGGGCQLVTPIPATADVMPSIVASYPGSGEWLITSLIPALTGFEVGSLSDASFEEVDSVAYTTHYPHTGSVPPWTKERTNRAVILIRNPMDAIPSQIGAVHEEQSDSELLYMDEEDFNLTDEKFTEEMEKWEEMVRHWMETEEFNEKLVLSFEDLTSGATGAATATRLAEFFDESPGVEAIGTSTVPCAWKKVLRGETQFNSLRGTTDEERGEEYTLQQMELMAETLFNLSSEYAHEKDLSAILNGYIVDVQVKYQALLKKELEQSR